MKTGGINIGDGSCITLSSNYISTGTTCYDPWSLPVLVDVIKGNDYVSLVYKQESLITYCSGHTETRAIKETYSVVDGKWTVDVVYGKVIPPQDETYEFDESE